MNNYNIKTTKAKGILYLYIFIASIFIFLLSGTFAYMAAYANDELSGNIYDASLTLNVTKKNNTDNAAMIPYSVDTTQVSSVNEMLTNNCTNNGDIICEIYEIELSCTNTSESLSLYTNLYSASGSNITNLKYVYLGDKTTTAKSSLGDMTISSLDTINTITNDSSILGTAKTFTISSTNHYYYYMMVWIDDTGSNDDEGTYQGRVTLKPTNSDGEGQITATLS